MVYIVDQSAQLDLNVKTAWHAVTKKTQWRVVGQVFTKSAHFVEKSQCTKSSPYFPIFSTFNFAIPLAQLFFTSQPDLPLSPHLNPFAL